MTATNAYFRRTSNNASFLESNTNITTSAAAVTGNSSIEQAFSFARKEGRRSALIGFLMLGDPSPKRSLKLCQALIDGGVDILELGIPFSDPIADGSTIQAADVRSLNAGTTIETCFEIAHVLRKENKEIPLVFLTYYNPVFRFGIEKFLKRAAATENVQGLVSPDLPEMESVEFESYRSLARENGLATILLASPTTTKDNLQKILEKTSGFLYLVSLTGVTGVRKNILGVNQTFIRRVCKLANGSKPVAVGFGISTPSQVRTVAKAGADGVIVGSAFVDIVARNLGDIDRARVQLEKFTRELRAATRC